MTPTQPREKVTLYLPPDVATSLRVEGARTRTELSRIVEAALRAYLPERGTPKAVKKERTKR